MINVFKRLSSVGVMLILAHGAYAQPLQFDLQKVVPAISGSGAVGVSYRIGTYEVTNEQYAAFLNAVAASDPYGLYDTSMGSSPVGGITRSGSSGSYVYSVKTNYGDKPVYFIRWTSAARFVNWLQNGQPAGTGTESGSYDFVTYCSSDDACTYINMLRVSQCRWFLPSKNEWRKAAMYDVSTDSFWNYATQVSSPAPTQATVDSAGNITNPGANVVNYGASADWGGSSGGNVTTVGSAGSSSQSAYGTYDQNGNVPEWLEMIVTRRVVGCGEFEEFQAGRVVVGGGFATTTASDMQVGGLGWTPLVIPYADFPHTGSGECVAYGEQYNLAGFRVATRCAGDMDCNGQVDETDYDLFDDYYTGEDPLADVNYDGVIDYSDYLEFLDSYGSGC